MQTPSITGYLLQAVAAHRWRAPLLLRGVCLWSQCPWGWSCSPAWTPRSWAWAQGMAPGHCREGTQRTSLAAAEVVKPKLLVPHHWPLTSPCKVRMWSVNTPRETEQHRSTSSLNTERKLILKCFFQCRNTEFYRIAPELTWLNNVICEFLVVTKKISCVSQRRLTQKLKC